MLLHKDAIPAYLREAEAFIALCSRINDSVRNGREHEVHEEKEELQRMDDVFGRIYDELHETHREFIREDNLVDQICSHARRIAEKIEVPVDIQELRTADKKLLSGTRAAVESTRLARQSIELLKEHIPDGPGAIHADSVRIIEEETRKGVFHMRDFTSHINQYNEICSKTAGHIHELRRFHEDLGAFVTSIASLEGDFEDNVRSWLPAL